MGGVTGIGLGLFVPWIHVSDKSNAGKDVAYDPRPDVFRMRLLPAPLDHGAGLFVSRE